MSSIQKITSHQIFTNKWFWFSVILVANFSFKIYNISYGSYFLDEAANLWYYQQDFGTVIDRSLNDANPPGYGIIMWSWIKMFGISEISTRIFSVIVSSLSAGLIFLLGKRFIGFNVGLIAALFFTASDFQFFYAHLARPYAFVTLEIILSYFILLIYTQKRTTLWLLIYTLINICALYTHPTIVFNLIAQGLFAIIFWIYNKDLRFLFSVGTAIFISIGCYFLWYINSPFFQKETITWLETPNWNSFKFVISSLLNRFWFIYILLGGLIVFAILSFKRKFKIDKGNTLVLILLWFLVPVIGNILFSTYAHLSIFNAYYNITIIPGYCLLLAFILDYVLDFNKIVKITIFSGLFIMMIGTMNLNTKMPENWRDSVEYIKTRKSNNSLVIVSPAFQLRSFAFYYNQEYYSDYKQTTAKMIEEKVFPENFKTTDEILTGNPLLEKIIIVVASKEPYKNPTIIDLKERLIETKFTEFDNIKVLEFKTN